MGFDKVKGVIIKAFFILIPVIIILICNGIPLIQTFIRSFYEWDGISLNRYIGTENYAKIIHNPTFWLMLKNNLILLVYIPVVILIGITLAVLLFNQSIKGRGFLNIIYLPQIFSTIVIGKVFSLYFSLDGPINKLLGLVNIEPVYWFGNTVLSFIIILLCIIWLSFGWETILFSGSLSSIDMNIKELTFLDGVGFFKSILLIYIPLLKRTIFYSFFINLLFGFSGFFPVIFVLTNGGPGYETTTIDYMIYLRAFGSEGELGEAYALSVILLGIVLLLIGLFYIWYRKVFGKE